jgi:hypothetical protein
MMWEWDESISFNKHVLITLTVVHIRPPLLR